MVTLKEIASRSGVSISTVSYYLNKKITLPQNTAERIETALKELDYQPKRITKKKQEQRLVGVIIPDIENPYYATLVKKLELALIRYRYSLILSNTDYSYDLEYNFIEVLKKKEVNGVILSPANSLPRKKKVNLDIPLVLLDEKIENIKSSCFTIDNFKGGYIATNFLIQKGLRKIVFLRGTHGTWGSIERFEGYTKAHQENAIPIDDSLVIDGNFNFSGGYNAITQLLQTNKKFDAIFAANDFSAVGAIESLKKEGIAIPEEVSIIGFDDIWLASMITPKLTTIKQPLDQICQKAVDTLIRTIEDPSIIVYETFEPQLIIRDSCKP